MLSQLNAIKPGLNNKIITTDYELAFIKAAQDIFVGADSMEENIETWITSSLCRRW